jgi:NADH dehydrogenase FAD-containing subunit
VGKRILVLGAGFGGLTAANMLRNNLSSEHRVIVIERKNWFMMGLVKLWILEVPENWRIPRLLWPDLPPKG